MSNDFKTIRNTRTFLGGGSIIYADSNMIPDDALFTKCKVYNKCIKCDIYPFVSHRCDKFMRMQEEFCRKWGSKFQTQHSNISRKLSTMNCFIMDDPNARQAHTAKDDNEITRKLLEKAFRTDPSSFKNFPFNYMIPIERNPVKKIALS